MKQRLHAGIGAPDRDQQAGGERKAQGGRALDRNEDHLLSQEDDGRTRRDARQGRHLLLYAVHVGEQAVEGHERRQPRKQGEQQEEGHPAGHGGDVILVERLPGAPEDVAPSARRNLRRGSRQAAPARFAGAEPGFSQTADSVDARRPQSHRRSRKPRGDLQALAKQAWTAAGRPVLAVQGWSWQTKNHAATGARRRNNLRGQPFRLAE